MLEISRLNVVRQKTGQFDIVIVNQSFTGLLTILLNIYKINYIER